MDRAPGRPAGRMTKAAQRSYAASRLQWGLILPSRLIYVLRKPLVLSVTAIILPAPKTASLFFTPGFCGPSAGSKRNTPRRMPRTIHFVDDTKSVGIGVIRDPRVVFKEESYSDLIIARDAPSKAQNTSELPALRLRARRQAPADTLGCPALHPDYQPENRPRHRHQLTQPVIAPVEPARAIGRDRRSAAPDRDAEPSKNQ